MHSIPSMNPRTPYIGTASWSIRTEHQTLFPAEGSILEKYSQKLNAVEINSSFYKDHQGKTYLSWAESVPESFRFSVKLSKVYTHEHKLQLVDDHLHKVLTDIAQLGEKFAVLLIQLPPSLAFDRISAIRFFIEVKKNCGAQIALEPRHISWTSAAALEVLNRFEISLVLADPEVCKVPSSFHQHMTYVRLHGSPKIYRSNYSTEDLKKRISLLKKQPGPNQNHPIWIIFDNTADGFATLNALESQTLFNDYFFSTEIENRNGQ